MCFSYPLHQFFYQSKTLISMEGETIKIMNQDLMRVDRFDGYNFTMWQEKVGFLLMALKIYYILDPTLAPLPKPKEDDTAEVVAKRKKREEDELICRGHILNALSDRLYDFTPTLIPQWRFGRFLKTNTKLRKKVPKSSFSIH